MRQRLFQVLRTVGAVTLLGLLYVLWGGLTRLWLPCPFHLLTGLDCPGCGVTRMCRALLRLDLSAAWAANPCGSFPLLRHPAQPALTSCPVLSQKDRAVFAY